MLIEIDYFSNQPKLIAQSYVQKYLKIAWRNLLKERQFTLLNLVGLSTGLACTLLIYLWVKDELLAIKYSDKYLHGYFENGVQTGGRITYVRLFSIIALFILVIACINFMNLSTAKASGRMKEGGIRKAIGAFRWSLVIQYLGE